MTKNTFQPILTNEEPMPTLTDEAVVIDEPVSKIVKARKERKKSSGCQIQRYTLLIYDRATKQRVSHGTFSSFQLIAKFLSAFNDEYEAIQPAACKYIMKNEKRRKSRNITIERTLAQPSEIPFQCV